jgi:hypothetical protein
MNNSIINRSSNKHKNIYNSFSFQKGEDNANATVTTQISVLDKTERDGDYLEMGKIRVQVGQVVEREGLGANEVESIDIGEEGGRRSHRSTEDLVLKQ